ncbi:hypothetical protein AVEN_193865-1 [Araneus ventricosus]|uniref:Helitron helicase-like domain-containing protein n=1 Tax=Araneus ventricosus TaxID=182803 RepID=A0A4Y2V5I5_ARAVE|nr:hypothetical protein AVEN_193865-1 [Araneus ventricosus]
MSIVRDFGKPDLFLSFTCIPKWNEIKDDFLGQNLYYRPDLVARAFDIEIKALIQDLIKKCRFILPMNATRKSSIFVKHSLSLWRMLHEELSKMETGNLNLECAVLPPVFVQASSTPRIAFVIASKIVRCSGFKITISLSPSSLSVSKS